MALLDNLEKLINEHGSATILKERIELVNDKYSLLEDKNSSLQAKVKELESQNKTLNLNLEKAKLQIRNLEKQITSVHDVNPDGYVCDHCGSGSLQRAGSRPDPTFGRLGIKQKLFICNECGKESAFTPDP